MSEPAPLSIGELFAGAGGFGAGGWHAGMETRWAVEINPQAVATYQRNMPDTLMLPIDVREVDYDTMPPIDILTAGFPCNEFSQLQQTDGIYSQKHRHDHSGIMETGSYAPLYREVSRALTELQPAMLLAENVEGLATSPLIHVIVAEWRECGYRVWWDVVDAADYAVPQTRRRVIIVGIRADIDAGWRLPPAREDRVSCCDALSGISHYADRHEIRELTKSENLLVPYMPRAHKRVVDSTESRWHEDIHNLTAEEATQAHDTWEQHCRLFTGNRYRRVPAKGLSPTITASHADKLFHWHLDRRLTLRELARLQTFDDHWILKGSYGSVCSQLGMAIPPALAQALLEQCASVLAGEVEWQPELSLI